MLDLRTKLRRQKGQSMADDNNLLPFLTPPSSAGSTNAGTWQAQQGQTLSPQQSHESAASYEQRLAAYNYAKKDQ